MADVNNLVANEYSIKIVANTLENKNTINNSNSREKTPEQEINNSTTIPTSTLSSSNNNNDNYEFPITTTTSNNNNSSSTPCTSSSIIMPAKSFLLSTLLNKSKPTSLYSTSSPGLGDSLHKQPPKSKRLNRSDGDDDDDDEDHTDSDSGVKITYEQILSKPPRKRLCYCIPTHNNGNNQNVKKSSASSEMTISKTSTETTITMTSPMSTSDEENNITGGNKEQNGSETLSQQQANNNRSSPPSVLPRSGSSSPVSAVPMEISKDTTSSSSSSTSSTTSSASFPIVIRTDQFRRKGYRCLTHNVNDILHGHSSSSSANGHPRVESYIVASRDIEQGEIILQENPLIASPISRKGKTLDKSKYCLGCYQTVNGLYKCTKCGWPVCNAKCEKIPDHAEFECEVFKNNPVSPIVHSSEYEKIKVLRCLLLRDKYPERWNKLLELDAHDELRQGNFVAVSSTINVFKFIRQECHLKQFVGETVNHVVGVCSVNAFPTDGLLSPSSCISSSKIQQSKEKGGGLLSSNYYVPTNASLLFFNASLLTQNCVPNSYPIISKTSQNSYLLTVIASQHIKKGEIITHSFVDSTRGTFQRRSQLKEDYYFSCDCKRCSDPSELCTHYSSLKCPKPSCSNGYLYPSSSLSLDLTGHWFCNYTPRCDFRITNGQVNELLKHVQYDISKTFVQHSLFQEYENLEAVLDKYKGKVLHPNHFLIMDIQYAIISCINKLLVLVNEEEALKLATKQIEYCRACLEMADILHPGSNRLRGNLLFYLHEGMLIIFLGEFKRNIYQESFLKIGKNKFEEIIRIMNESRSILINEPEGSTEFNKIKALTLDSSNLQPLLKYFNIQV